MIYGLHAVLSANWQSDAIPSDWKRGLVAPIRTGKGTERTAGITKVLHCSVCKANFLLIRIQSHLAKFRRPKQFEFTPGKSTDKILVLCPCGILTQVSIGVIHCLC